MKHSKDIAYLRQLCCLGLDKEILIPEFLHAVQTVIPCSNNVFTGISADLLPDYFLQYHVEPDLVEVIPVAMSKYWTPARSNRLLSWFIDHPVLTDQKAIDSSFSSSDLYNLVYRPLNIHHGLHAPVMQYGRMAGILALFRPGNQKPFSVADQELMICLTPYLAHALSGSAQHEIQYDESHSSGMMIWDKKETLLFQCDAARKLMVLACHPLAAVQTSGKEAGLHTRLIELCRNLQTVFQGKPAPPPTLQHINGRGRFLFRAYQLNRYDQETGGLIGITIEHQEPLTLKILRIMKTAPLSPVQKEVTMLLVQGLSNEKIGERLSIKLTTVKDHVSKVFTKLDIHRREELLSKLTSLDSSIN